MTASHELDHAASVPPGLDGLGAEESKLPVSRTHRDVIPTGSKGPAVIEPNPVLGPILLSKLIQRTTDSAVYAGQYLHLGSDVMVHLGWNPPVEDRTRFLREALIACRLRTPGLVRTIDFGDYMDVRYMVTDRAPGVPLWRHLEAKPEPLPERAIRAIVRLAGEVLEVCHGAGLAHRDLGASVLWLDRRGRLWLSGSGMAPAIGRAQIGGSTAPALSPGLPVESSDPQVGARADVFALGVLGYLLAFQRPPLEQRTADGVARGIEAAAFDLPTHCSSTFIELIADMIHPDPRARVDSARHLLERLSEPSALAARGSGPGAQAPPPEAHAGTPLPQPASAPPGVPARRPRGRLRWLRRGRRNP